ncbi:hypothetical protein [Moorena sp. SIO3I8]|uniref:hypothetical protein n=1 Tax=Moorena sp. SIO3I8 TaxID=2607833 RepID=UPI0013BF8E68|nr:hypothetical protein [Moorena sp. SIO3I8]NEO04816.1 hypothetical protein [Moorena sp. SIO3I8]
MATLREQPWPLATLREQPWPLATLREQPSTHPTSDAKSEQPSTITYFRPVSQ